MEKHPIGYRSGISESRSVSDTVNGSHRFEIRGYSLAKGMGVGKYMASDTFSVGGYDWMVQFYPDGKNADENSVYVSVFVSLASEGVDVRALFELTLVDQSGKGKHKVHSHFDRALETGPYTLKYRGSMWGYKRFYRRTSLEKSNYLKDDCIVLNCTVGVVRCRMERPTELSFLVPPSDMGGCVEELLKSSIGSDIVFEVDEEEFKAHKLILAARSPVFRAQFFGPIGNQDVDKVVVDDVPPLIFKAMLLFIYSDVLPDINELAESASLCTSTNILQHLLAAADRYGLDRMKSLCEAKLSEDLSADTVVSTMALAEQHHCAHLKSVCLKFVGARENLGAVLQTEGFGHLEQTCPSLLSNLLKAVALVDDGSDPSSIKRSSSSIIGQNIMGDENPNGRQKRRLV